MNNNLSTKEKIFEAAVELFSKRGYNGVSVRDIAKEVGIKEASIYNHYNSKEEILNDIINRFNDVFEKGNNFSFKMDLLYDSVSPRKYFKMVNLMIKEVFQDKRMMKMLMICIIEMYNNEKAKEMVKKMLAPKDVESMNMYLNKYIKEGKIKNVNVQTLQDHINYFLFSAYLETTINVSKDNEIDFDEFDKRMIKQIDFIFDLIEI